jgi:orotidine-5'-phosphate decarboxylase
MVVPFFKQLSQRATDLGSLLCVGLDPEPNALANSGDIRSDLFDFCKRIVDATYHVTLLYKPNSAFFERFVSISPMHQSITLT